MPAPPTTMQTTAPLRRVPANAGQEPMRQVALFKDLVLDPPYQRGAVWGMHRRRNLVRSLLLGIPVGNVFLNQRPSPSYEVAVVDGRQRIETIQMFLASRLDVPASWFPDELVSATTPTDDGPYVTYEQLTARGRGLFDRCSITTQRCTLATVEEEAELFALIKYGGLPQGATDTDTGADGTGV